ncbi:MAG: hypothetical protein WC969_00685 [Elusimicrobiota bacterium]|jgi:hypothetical protein
MKRTLPVLALILLAAGLFILYRSETWSPAPADPAPEVLYRASSEKSLPPPGSPAPAEPRRGIPKGKAAAALAVLVVGAGLSSGRTPRRPA